jgi:UDP-N-acetyl-D-mannosaminuronic acid dehydrogenase
MKSDVKPDVCVVGLGYIGLPTAAIIARAGCKVLGVDVSQRVVDTINRGEIHIEEVDLDGLVHGVVARGLLALRPQMAPADVFVIAVPTPFDKDHAPDISYVLAAGEAVARCSRPATCVILESTSPVGTTEAAARSDRRGLRPDLKCPGLTAKRPTSRSPIARNACCPARSWKN